MESSVLERPSASDISRAWLSGAIIPEVPELPIDSIEDFAPIFVDDGGCGFLSTSCGTEDCSTEDSCGTTTCVTEYPCIGSTGVCGC